MDSETIAITVTNTNRPPVFTPSIGDRVENEGAELQFTVTATDPDGNGIASITMGPTPPDSSFIDNLDGTGTFIWTPGFDDEGAYGPITFRATDDDGSDPLFVEEAILITISNTNRAPELAEVGNREINEGGLLEFTVTASDPDGTVPGLSMNNRPGSSGFTDNADGTGTFSWSTGIGDAGNYSGIEIVAGDGDLQASESITISVGDVDQPPVLQVIGDRSVDEGELLSFTVTAGDVDGPVPSLAVAPLPPGASFIDNLDGTGSFSWTPDFASAGSDPGVTFTADSNGLTDEETISITVLNANRVPELAAIANQSVDEGQLLEFTVTASDPDGTNPSFSASVIPDGATFSDNSDGTGSFSWTPGVFAADEYVIEFTASDGDLDASDSVTVTVVNVNLPPSIDFVPAQRIGEGQILAFMVTVSDSDPVAPTLFATALPDGATFDDTVLGTGSFLWTPGPGASEGSPYLARFETDDGEFAATRDVFIHVTPSDCPILYGASTGTSIGENPSSLYSIDPATGAATLIGPIGFSGVTGMAFRPDGVLVASASIDDTTRHSILIRNRRRHPDRRD